MTNSGGNLTWKCGETSPFLIVCYPPPLSVRISLTLGNSAEIFPDRIPVVAPPAATWPFLFPLSVDWPDRPAVLLVRGLHEAFVNHQTANTRLVTTQASYLLQSWTDDIGERDVVIAANGNRDSLSTHAPELLARRGMFAAIDLRSQDDDPSFRAPEKPGGEAREDITHCLVPAMRVSDPTERLRLCVRALDAARTPGGLLATASTCMEVNDLDAAARDLDEAIEQAPDWAAAHFERGKLWLRLDDMERASESFARAASLMPHFASAWANLGATLGELDRATEALDAFRHALACDPSSPQALNNVGVVSRELGKLPESEAAFRQVIQLAPDMAFGYYNLGHTLFLAGRYQAALGAYVEGQKRDSERNPVQASRLAMCRLASGDAPGALRDLQRATGGLPREYRRQLLADTSAIAWALLTHRPDLAGWQQVNAWLTGELAK